MADPKKSPWLSMENRNPGASAVQKYVDKIMSPAALEPTKTRQYRMDRQHHPGQAFGFTKIGLHEPKMKKPKPDVESEAPAFTPERFGFKNNI